MVLLSHVMIVCLVVWSVCEIPYQANGSSYIAFPLCGEIVSTRLSIIHGLMIARALNRTILLNEDFSLSLPKSLGYSLNGLNGTEITAEIDVQMTRQFLSQFESQGIRFGTQQEADMILKDSKNVKITDLRGRKMVALSAQGWRNEINVHSSLKGGGKVSLMYFC